jgi:hypothetical protein
MFSNVSAPSMLGDFRRFLLSIERCINNRNIFAVMLLSSDETTGESGRVGEAAAASGATS